MLLNIEKNKIVQLPERQSHVKSADNKAKQVQFSEIINREKTSKTAYIPLPETDPFVFPEQAF